MFTVFHSTFFFYSMYEATNKDVRLIMINILKKWIDPHQIQISAQDISEVFLTF